MNLQAMHCICQFPTVGPPPTDREVSCQVLLRDITFLESGLEFNHIMKV